MNIFTTDFFFSIIRIATPILFATLAAEFERQENME